MSDPIEPFLDKITVGDCLETMRRMRAAGARVNCIVTSPPCWGLRDYAAPGQYGLELTFREHVAKMVEVFSVARELLAVDGTLWLVYGDSYVSGRPLHHTGAPASSEAPDPPAANPLRAKNLIGMPWRVAFALQDEGWYLRSDIIWHKPNTMPESTADRPTKAHDYLFLFSRSPRYYYDAGAISVESSPDSHARAARGRSADSKWAGGGPDGQNLTRANPAPGVNKKVAGWAEGKCSHEPKDHARARAGLWDSTKFGHRRVKQNQSFSSAVVRLRAQPGVRGDVRPRAPGPARFSDLITKGDER